MAAPLAGPRRLWYGARTGAGRAQSDASAAEAVSEHKKWINTRRGNR